MINYIKNIIKQIYIFHNLYIKNKVYIKKKFYSQNKEDIFVLAHFKNKNSGFYVDVGCHHPTRINNTFLLYEHGWRGVNIDMSKLSIDLFNNLRKEDVNIHSAVSNKNKIISYYTNKDLFLSASITQKKGNSKFSFLSLNPWLTFFGGAYYFKLNYIIFLSSIIFLTLSNRSRCLGTRISNAFGLLMRIFLNAFKTSSSSVS